MNCYDDTCMISKQLPPPDTLQKDVAHFLFARPTSPPCGLAGKKMGKKKKGAEIEQLVESRQLHELTISTGREKVNLQSTCYWVEIETHGFSRPHTPPSISGARDTCSCRDQPKSQATEIIGRCVWRNHRCVEFRCEFLRSQLLVFNFLHRNSGKRVAVSP